KTRSFARRTVVSTYLSGRITSWRATELTGAPTTGPAPPPSRRRAPRCHTIKTRRLDRDVEGAFSQESPRGRKQAATDSPARSVGFGPCFGKGLHMLDE